MNLGEKIKKYRLLRGKTQKQLGEDVGFKSSTADVRINQYETNKVAPKVAIRQAIANALDIDLVAISDTYFQSYEDIMYILFELEENMGMKVNKKDGEISLTFEENKASLPLITYLNIWKEQRTALVPTPESATEEHLRNYQIWKARFTTNVRNYFSAKQLEIENTYKDCIDNMLGIYTYAQKTSEISSLIRKVIEAGFTVTTSYSYYFQSTPGPEFSFIVNELLNPPSNEAKELFAQFLCELNHIKELGAEVYTKIQIPKQSLIITYCIPIASFAIIKTQVDSVLDFYKNSDSKNDVFIDVFEESYQDSLASHYNYIKDEIEFYKHKGTTNHKK